MSRAERESWGLVEDSASLAEVFCVYSVCPVAADWGEVGVQAQRYGLSHRTPLFVFAGAYSCLKVELILKREFSYYLITIYVPCCMLVIVSWVSFWLDQNAIPARVSLGVTTLLTMSTQASGINAQLPPVSYTKAIDVWTGVSRRLGGCIQHDHHCVAVVVASGVT